MDDMLNESDSKRLPQAEMAAQFVVWRYWRWFQDNASVIEIAQVFPHLQGSIQTASCCMLALLQHTLEQYKFDALEIGRQHQSWSSPSTDFQSIPVEATSFLQEICQVQWVYFVQLPPKHDSGLKLMACFEYGKSSFQPTRCLVRNIVCSVVHQYLILTHYSTDWKHTVAAYLGASERLIKNMKQVLSGFL